jgi:hypothetical protein
MSSKDAILILVIFKYYSGIIGSSSVGPAIVAGVETDVPIPTPITLL